MTKCSIIKDLLTVYVSGLCSEDTCVLVDEHIETCEDCRKKLTELQNRVAVTLRENDAKGVNVFKALKKRIFRQNVLVAAIAAVVVAVIALFVGVNVIGDTPIAYYDGLVKVQVNYAEFSYSSENIIVIITDPVEKSEITAKIPVLDITCAQNYYSSNSTGRTIMRDGEKVNVQYICYTENTLTKLQTDKKQGEHVFRLAHADLNEDEPVKYEIYYLTDPKAATTMSDKEYDDYRNTGTLIWSGILE